MILPSVFQRGQVVIAPIEHRAAGAGNKRSGYCNDFKNNTLLI